MDDLRPGAVGRIGWEATASVDAVAVLNGSGFRGLQVFAGQGSVITVYFINGR